jgi:putative flippase GtrA
MMKRLLVFALGSLLGAGIDFFLGYLLLLRGIEGALAIGLAMSISAIVVYFYHEFFTYRSVASKTHKGRLSAFLLSTFFIYLSRISVFYLLLFVGLMEVIALAVALVSSLTINYFISTKLIFKR